MHCYIPRVKKNKLYSLYFSDTYSVLKPLPQDIEVPQTYYCGPRCNEKGEILAHSILGDIQTFVMEAERRGQFKVRPKKLTKGDGNSECM